MSTSEEQFKRTRTETNRGPVRLTNDPITVPSDDQAASREGAIAAMEKILPLLEEAHRIWAPTGGDANHYGVCSQIFNVADNVYMGRTLYRLKLRWKQVLDQWKAGPEFSVVEQEVIAVIEKHKLDQSQLITLKGMIERFYG